MTDVTGSPAGAPTGLTTEGEWFRHAGLGIFIHWDHASQQGMEVSWPLVTGTASGGRTISVADYLSSAATFDPRDWDAAALARLIKGSGATYAVFTARHHAGYSMFHSAYSDFGIEHSNFGRDVTAEYIAALRAEGIRVGLYYSLSDWRHPDYPPYTDADRPYHQEHWPAAGLPDNADLPVATDRHPRTTPEGWARYRQYLRGQLTELLTRHGRIDLLWFDGEWERSEQEWDSQDLRALIKSLQPDVVINDRLLGAGDYVTPEQGLPTVAPDGPWELCLTMGHSWQYDPSDVDLMSARMLAVTMLEAVSRGGNLLLNIGPTGTGAIPAEQRRRLEQIGDWLRVHHDAVIGVDPAPDVQFYGPVTRSGDRIFLHLVNRPIEQVIVRNIAARRVSAVRLLATGEVLDFTTRFDVHGADDQEPRGELRIAAPEPSGALIDVIEITLDESRSRR